MKQPGLLADKKRIRKDRCSDEYFFFTVCEIHFSGFIEALDTKRILCSLKKVLREPYNVLLCPHRGERWCNTTVCVDQVIWCYTVIIES